MSTAIFRSVGSHSADASFQENFHRSVLNTGNQLFQNAILSQVEADQIVDDWDNIPNDISALVLTFANFIRPTVEGLEHQVAALERSSVERIILAGIGAQSYTYDEDLKIAEPALRLLKVASERSRSIGVRGYYTAELLNKHGITNVEVIGCPSIFFAMDPDFQIHPKEQKPDGTRLTIHATDDGHYRDKLSSLYGYAAKHAADYVLQSEPFMVPIFNPPTENVYEATRPIRFFAHYYNNGQVSPDDMEKWLKEHSRVFFSVEKWVEYLKTRNLVMGSRFHGNVAALMAGVPSLTMFFDSRVRELCEYLELPGISLEDFDHNRPLADYFELANYTNFNAGFSRKYRRYYEFLETNGLKHRLRPSTTDETVGGQPALVGSLVKALPFEDRVRMFSLLEHVNTISGGGASLMGLLNRVRSMRSEKSGLMAEASDPKDFKLRMPSISGD